MSDSGIDQSYGDVITGADIVEGALVLRRRDGSTVTYSPSGGGGSTPLQISGVVTVPLLEHHNGGDMVDFSTKFLTEHSDGDIVVFDAMGMNVMSRGLWNLDMRVIFPPVEHGEEEYLKVSVGSYSNSDGTYFNNEVVCPPVTENAATVVPIRVMGRLESGDSVAVELTQNMAQDMESLAIYFTWVRISDA